MAHFRSPFCAECRSLGEDVEADGSAACALTASSALLTRWGHPPRIALAPRYRCGQAVIRGILSPWAALAGSPEQPASPVHPWYAPAIRLSGVYRHTAEPPASCHTDDGRRNTHPWHVQPSDVVAAVHGLNRWTSTTNPGIRSFPCSKAARAFTAWFGKPTDHDEALLDARRLIRGESI
jgi:hypothetical protein